jgi:triosephosphate isomerase
VTRVPYLAGNWKMNLDRRRARELAAALREGLSREIEREVAVFPPFVYVEEVARALAGSRIKVGAQNACDKPEGAYTGEISVAMLRDVGAEAVILGHSERRHVYGETDELVNHKVHAALEGGLEVIACVGETLDERNAGKTEEVNGRQLTRALAGVSAEQMQRVTIAYEPVWAIGTGQTATPAQAGEVHAYLRGLLSGLYDSALAEAVRIQYGGSVKPENISELMAVPNVDGALVGGASLNARSFLSIVLYR